MTTPKETISRGPDPVSILKGFASLRRLAGTYPAGHPMIAQKLTELDEVVRRHLLVSQELRVDVIQSELFLNAVSFGRNDQANGQTIRDLAELGIDSIHVREGVDVEELRKVAEFLWELKDSDVSEPLEAQLSRRGITHIKFGRFVQLDTRWRSQQWPDAPTVPLDPAYEEAIHLTEQTFDSVEAGKEIEAVTVRDLVQLLIYKVARSNAALGQILAVKLYENLTYCHSVNVAMVSLLIGRQIQLDEQTIAALVEAALLHDIGKTRIPLEIVKKPGALDKRERKLIEAHTKLGSEILVQTEGLRPLTPTVALEHHRSVKGGGYPDIGNAVPHMMSQIVSVADIYEAITGARSYQDPTPPERACLILARLAGEKLNTALVKAFVNAITFFPIGSVVRTSRDEIGVVTATNRDDPLHPIVTLVDESCQLPGTQIDTRARDMSHAYERHILETLRPPEGLDVRNFLPAAA
jgi:putative nucleotidyltransferase with HDIG domain